MKPEKILDQRTLQIENTKNGKTENLESLKMKIRPNSANSTAKSGSAAGARRNTTNMQDGKQRNR